MKNSWRIAEISFGRSHWDAAYTFNWQGHHFEVQRFGANYSFEYLKSLIVQLRNDVDAFALVSFPSPIHLDQQTFAHKKFFEILNFPCHAPICDGTGLREIANLQTLDQKLKSQEIDPELGLFFPGAFLSMELEEYLRKKYPQHLYIGDAFPLFGAPLAIKPFKGLKLIGKGTYQMAGFLNIEKSSPKMESPHKKLSHNLISLQVEKTQYVIGDLPFLTLFDGATEFMKGKDIIFWSHHPSLENKMQKYRPRSLMSLLPASLKISPYVNYSVLDAAFRLIIDHPAPFTFFEWEQKLNVSPEFVQEKRFFYIPKKESAQSQMLRLSHTFEKKIRQRRTPIDFAFVIHSLSHQNFSYVPGCSFLRYLPKKWDQPIDRALSHLPAFPYGSIRHIISKESGREVNGQIYALWETPQQMKIADPLTIYNKILKVCEQAADDGAQIIGLGAYTKVIGDAGLTISSKSPIPVTTGNSLSASATLWAVHAVVQKMKLYSRDPQTQKVQGLAMIIGATGSIGKVSAKLLSLVFNRICIVAPRRDRLEDVAHEIKAMNPSCEVLMSQDANRFAPMADVLVTATSAFDQKIVDVMKLKPGCVVCDCSRPLDFTMEDARKRPDVLIIESGEVELPGPVRLDCNIGLPGTAVYACLAETALLALEQRYEAFTLGRDIEWTKVKEIYQLARKHGVHLSAIQGHAGPITDREIELTRELALLQREKQLDQWITQSLLNSGSRQDLELL